MRFDKFLRGERFLEVDAMLRPAGDRLYLTR